MNDENDLINAIGNEITAQGLGRTILDGPARLKILTPDEREFYLLYYVNAGILQLVCWSTTRQTDFTVIHSLDIRDPRSIDKITRTLRTFPQP